jgi:hypothetical protein
LETATAAAAATKRTTTATATGDNQILNTDREFLKLFNNGARSTVQPQQ